MCGWPGLEQDEWVCVKTADGEIIYISNAGFSALTQALINLGTRGDNTPFMASNRLVYPTQITHVLTPSGLWQPVSRLTESH